MNTGLDQHGDILKDAVEDLAAKKLTKVSRKILIEVIILSCNTKKDKFHPNGEVWLAC